MKEQIQQLIANGQTKEALSLLTQISGDALLLQAQYNNGEKQFNLGLIEFSEWGRIQARVNFAALELAAKSKPASGTGSVSIPLRNRNRPPLPRIQTPINAPSLSFPTTTTTRIWRAR
ncbi:MAG: hypothetical protein IPK76_05355 [Lewinellaceae bacterium]|nr:hypothetical protein [Lewinellaceae bacterium]